MSLHVIILAAGQGTRMKSSLPKVLHPLGGRPMLQHVLHTARQLNPAQIHIVYGFGAEQVKAGLDADDINWVLQDNQNGTGHAVQLALQEIPDDQQICILYGDVPLLSVETLTSLLGLSGSIGVLTAHVGDAYGYGRIIRNVQGDITAIVEQRDASESQLAISEINTGMMAGQAGLFNKLLAQVDTDNDQGELYLTDIVALATDMGEHVRGHVTEDETEITGINDKAQLAAIERIYQRRLAEQLMKSGTLLYDPARLDIRGELICGRDVSIDVNCIIEGTVELQDGVSIGPNVCLKNAVIGKASVIKANSLIEDSTVGEQAIVGPFARLRPGTQLANQVHIGNFVEVKKSTIDEQSKVNHLSYVGDSEIGKRVNVGAGTITCNYDGAAKHQTVIEDDAFIGSGTELVAPIRIGKQVTVGAGSTLSRDVDENQLVVERSKTRSIKAWQRPKKK